MASQSYFWSPSVHWCVVRDFCVILDVAHNRYLSVPARTMERLLPHIRESDSDFTTSSPAHPTEVVSLSQELVASEILTTTYHPSAIAPDPEVPTPHRFLPQFPPTHMPPNTLLLAAPFLRACALSDYLLHHTSLSKIVARIASRRDRLMRMPVQSSDERITLLASAFLALRPFYPRRYWCMFDSLALLEFLSQWRIVAHWVFGVSTDPFSAHCWVQYRDLVLCDTRDFAAASLAKIMTI